MKVDIKHDEITRGLVFKKRYYQVSCTVTFSEEEKFVIKNQKLKEHPIHKRDYPADYTNHQVAVHYFYLTAEKLLKGTDTHTFETILEAKAYEVELMQSLKNFKDILSHSATIEEKNKSYEL